VIRFVDLRHVNLAGSRFAFWDTVTDRFLNIDGCEAFDDFAELCDYHATSDCTFPLERLVGHLPGWAMTADPKHDADEYDVVQAVR